MRGLHGDIDGCSGSRGDIADDDLVRMYARGDADAFDAIFDRYHVPLYSFARHMLRRPGPAEEVMQDTFLAVARAAREYTPRGRFRSWIMRIARNRCLNRLAVERNAERLRRAALAEGGLEVLDPPSAEPTPPESLEAGERASALRGAISRLPERQREVIVLYAFERMAYRDIASTLDMPVGTVKTLLHRARSALARALEESGREGGKTGGEKRHAV